MAGVLPLVLSIVGASAEQAQKANILFLMCDSMDGRVLDPTSPVSSRLEMPNLRALAADGVNFVRTYAASPQCVPSRTTMFTGRHTHQIQAWSNGQGLGTQTPTATSGIVDENCKGLYSEETCLKWGVAQNVTTTLADSMDSLGYNVKFLGKIDVGAQLDPNNTWGQGFHGGPSLPILTRTADIRKPTKPDPVSITDDSVNNVHPEDWKLFPQCIQYLDSLGRGGGARAAATEPWMLYCSINIPHPAFKTNATWLKSVHGDKVNPPKWPAREAFHPADSYQSISKAAWRNFTDEEIVRVRKTYYAMCAETDYMLGQVINKLKDKGLYESTYVMFVSDHGEMNMEHRQVWKNSMYEASERVPMIVAGPGVKKGSVVTSLTSLLDVYPTLVEMAGGTPPAYLSGKSLFPLLSEPTNGTDRAVVSQYHSNMGNTGSFMIRYKNWKYIAFGNAIPSIFKDYKPQLFDVDNDPRELQDVAQAQPDVVAMLDGMLKKVVDYQEVDKSVKDNDRELYKEYFVEKFDAKSLRKKFESAYTGFDDSDWAKVQTWLNATL